MNHVSLFFNKVFCHFASFCNSERGASGIEYAVIATIAAVTIAASASGNDSIADRIAEIFSQVKAALPTTTEV
ncbi:hypothetical protein BA894_19725 [Vibrio natriegens]|uniref:Flp family type IVb pilin n=1 Tax=Vibrio natriegens TaxID=691 RepID=UPI000803C9A1|nr:Flp family type IVb pilin [Vibrio natriegens]ANQ28642.1 hypothetical protein BA894_19725 [Vibrio natriegens]